MSSLNKVLLIGRLGKDPEVRQSAGGEVVHFSIATSEKYKKEERTEWHRCVAFGQTGHLIGEFCKKGHQIYIEGRISTNKWTDKDGQQRENKEVLVNQVVFLEGKERGQEQTAPAPQQARPRQQGTIPGTEQRDYSRPLSEQPDYSTAADDDYPF